MAGTRKSDYTGDTFGKWTVIGKPIKRQDWMVKGKRYWEVTDGDIVKVVEQINLEDLAREEEADDLLKAATAPTAESLSAGLDAVHAASGLVCADSDALVKRWVYPETANPFAAENDEPPVYVPRGDQAESAQIARKVIEAKLAEDDEAFVAALPVEDVEPDYSDPTEPDPADAIEVEGFKAVPRPPATVEAIERLMVDLAGKHITNVVTRFDGIGEAAEDGVSEAELDTRVPPADPARVAVRKLMGTVHDMRAMIDALGNQYQAVLKCVDEVMKSVVSG